MSGIPGTPDYWREYENCARLEQELVRNRWTFFTALLSVSFVVGGLALTQLEALGPLLGKAGFAFGWLISAAAFYHYRWFHKKCHDLRERLCYLEREKLGIEVYLIRGRRPTFRGRELYYHWAIDALFVFYTLMFIAVLVR
jgi:hypothetical protein